MEGASPEKVIPTQPPSTAVPPAKVAPSAETQPEPEASASKAVETRTSLATGLDAKGGFLGATFGSTTRAHRGLVATDARGETFRVPGKSYGGIALRDVLYMFRKGKLASIQFAAKSNDDCKALRDALTRELGLPQRAVNDTSTWRGEKVAMRFVITSSGACSGTVVSKDFARMEFDAL